MFGFDAEKFTIFIGVLHANIVKHLDDPNISVGIFLPLPLDLTSPGVTPCHKNCVFLKAPGFLNLFVSIN